MCCILIDIYAIQLFGKIQAYFNNSSFFSTYLDHSHYGYADDGREGYDPADSIGPHREVVVAILVTRVVNPGEHKNEL